MLGETIAIRILRVSLGVSGFRAESINGAYYRITEALWGLNSYTQSTTQSPERDRENRQGGAIMRS